jgi:hypothetical protein
MSNGNGNTGDLWVIVDHDGKRTLFNLVEMGNGGDALQLARELQAPAVVVDMALPALPTLDDLPGKSRRSRNSRLILLNIRTVAGGGGHVDGVVVQRSRQGEPLNASSVRHGDLPRARSAWDRA